MRCNSREIKEYNGRQLCFKKHVSANDFMQVPPWCFFSWSSRGADSLPSGRIYFGAGYTNRKFARFFQSIQHAHLTWPNLRFLLLLLKGSGRTSAYRLGGFERACGPSFLDARTDSCCGRICSNTWHLMFCRRIPVKRTPLLLTKSCPLMSSRRR